MSEPIYIKRGDKRAPLCAVWAKRAYPVSELELRDAGWVPADQTESEATEWALRWKQRSERLAEATRTLLYLLEATYEPGGKSANGEHDIKPYFDVEWPPECSPEMLAALQRIAAIVGTP